MLVKNEIKKLYPQTKLLPVGKCLSVKIDKVDKKRKNCQCITNLICCPTMTEPCDIRQTNNVFLAMKGLLEYLSSQKKPLKTVIPGLGTCTGRLSPIESANQIYTAINSNC